MRETRRSTALAWVVLATLLASAASVSAQVSEERMADYRAAAQAGVEAFNENDLATARERFERASTILPNPRVHRLLGRVALAEGNYVEAAQLFHRALSADDAGHPLSDRLRTEVESELLAEARTHVGEYQLDLRPEGALVRVDGEPAVMVEGVLILAPGSHALVVAAPGHERLERELQVEAGTRDIVALHLEESGAVADSGDSVEMGQTSETVDAASSGSDDLAPLSLGLLIGGGVVTVAGAVFVGVGWADASQVDGSDAWLPVEEAAGRADWMIPAGYVVAGVGLAAAAAGVVLMVIGPDDEDTEVSVRVSPQGVDVRGRF